MNLRNSTFKNPGKPLKRKSGMRSRSLLKPSLRSKVGKTQGVWKKAI
jgi:hypothetical protein